MASWHRIPIQSDPVALAGYLENLQAGEAAADKLREMRKGTVTHKMVQAERVNFQAQKVTFLENYVVDTALAGYPELRKLVMAQPDIETGKRLADDINAVLNADPPTPSADQILANYKAGTPLNSIPQAPGVGNPVAHGQAPVAPPAPVVAAPAAGAVAGFVIDPQVLADRAAAEQARAGPVTEAELWKAAPQSGAQPLAQIDEIEINTVLAQAAAQRRLNHGTFNPQNGYLEPNQAIQMDMASLQTYGAVVFNGKYLADEFATEGFLKLCFWNTINPADASITPAVVQAYGLLLHEANVRLSRTSGKRKAITMFWQGRNVDPTREMRGYGIERKPRKVEALVAGTAPRLGQHPVDVKHFEGGHLTLFDPNNRAKVVYSQPMSPGLKILLASPSLTKPRLAIVQGEGFNTMNEYRKILHLTQTLPKRGKRQEMLNKIGQVESDSDTEDEDDVTPSKTLQHRLKIISEELEAGNRSKKMVADGHRIILTLWERGDINKKERARLESLLK
jgi:hypothetical protein